MPNSMATEVALARDFVEQPHTAMLLPYPEAWMVGQIIRNNRDVLSTPLLLRLTEAQYGTAEEVVYAPNHLKLLTYEIDEVLKFLASKREEVVLGENLTGRATVGSVRSYLEKLEGVAKEGISERKGLFVITD